ELIGGRLDDDYAREIAEGLDVLASFGVSRDRVRLATSFTTATVLDGTRYAAEIARAAPAPAILEDFEIHTPEDGGRVQYRVVFEAPEYRRPAPESRWEMDADGRP